MVFDGHSDIWTDVTLRTLNGESSILKKQHLKRLEDGGIEGAIFVIWIDPPYTDNPQNRLSQILDSIDTEMKTASDRFKIVKSYEDILKAKSENKFYIIKGMEGISGLNSTVEAVDWAYEKGVRHASITWNEENAFGTGARGTEGKGLTSLGKEAVKRIMEKDMILDVSHANEKTFWDIINLADGPIVASHSNAKALCDAKRNLTDEQLKEIERLNGLVGINGFNMFVDKDPAKQDVEHFINQVIYISEKIGVEHVGFGFDFDGFLPKETIGAYSEQETSQTKGLEDCSKVPKLLIEMKNRGFSEKEIEMISKDNWMRVIKERIK